MSAKYGKIKLHTLYRKFSDALFRPFIAFAIALTFSGIFIVLIGENPFKAYGSLMKGAFVGLDNILTTLRWSVPYIITGIAAAVSFRAGMFNIGIEGSLCLGGLAAALVGTYVKGLPSVIHIFLCMLAAMIIGGLWLFLPALMRAKYGVNEMVMTWVFTFIAILLCQFLVSTFIQNYEEIQGNPQQVRTPFIHEAVKLPQLASPNQLNSSVFLALTLIILFYIFSEKTKYGYEHKITGLSSGFARYGGININRISFYSIIISGAIGGLAGACEVLGIHYRYIHGFSNNLGTNGILIALMGRLNPIGILVSSIFMGAMQSGAREMVRASNVSLDTMRIVISLVVICITADKLFTFFQFKKKAKRGY